MRAHLRPGSRLSWIVAWALAVAGPVVYLVLRDHAGWWLGLGLMLPLVGLAIWREEQRGSPSEPGAFDNGPWTPPPA